MSVKRRCRNSAPIGADPILGDSSATANVLSQLRILATRRAERDPIIVELQSCPAAYEAGKILETAFQRVADSDAFGDERILPMAGTIIPPLV